MKTAICLAASICFMFPTIAAHGQSTAPASQPKGQTLIGRNPSTLPAEPLKVSARMIDRPDEVVALLSNGMRVIVKQYKVAPIVAVRMYVRTGSIYEDPHLGAGLSHLFEHLLDGGTTSTRTEAQSRQLLTQIGGDSNAYTTYDHTCYHIDTAGKYLDTAVDLLSDWITRATFPNEEFNRELEVVQRELERSADDPETQLQQLTMKLAFQDHPAQFPVIGYKQNIQTLTKSDVVSYWQNRYIPDNVIVSICGDVDVEQALQVVLKHFADFTRRPLDLKTLPEPTAIVSPRSAIKRMNVNAAILNMCWPSIRLSDPDLYALDLASFILTAGPSARLTSELVYRDRLAVAVSGSSWTPEWARGIFEVQARCPVDSLVKVRKAALNAAEKLATEPVSEAELAKVKRLKTAEYVAQLQKVDTMAAMLASDLMSTGDPHFSADYLKRIQEVKPEDIQRVARKYLQPDRLITTLVAPQQAKLTEWEQVTQQRTLGQPSNTRLVKLDNGLRVLLQKNPATPIVSIQFYALGGLLAEDAKTNGISNLMAEASLRGTKTRTGDQIADFFDSIGAEIDGGAGSNTFYYKAEVLAESTREALDVFADVVLNPAFKSEAVQEVREPILDRIHQIDENWRSELMHGQRAKYFGQHPYGLETIGSIESVNRLTPEDLQRFHDQYLVGGNCILAIFGDIDVPAVEEQVRNLFGRMPAPKAPVLAPQFTASPNTGKLFIKVNPPERQVAGVGVSFPSVDFTDVKQRYAMTVMDTITSGYSIPSGWLHEALRGGTNKYVYEVHAINWTGLRGGFFPIYAGCQPEQVSKVIAIIRGLMDKARRGEFTDKELTEAKGVILTSQLLDRQTNSERAAMAALDELYGLGYEFSDKLPEVIESVTMDDVKNVAAKFLAAKPVIVVVTPDPKSVEVPGFQPVTGPVATQPSQ